MANSISKSEQLYSELITYGEKIPVALENLNKHTPDFNEAMKQVEEFDDVKNSFAELFSELYRQCIIDDFYWEYCPFKVYESNFESHKNQFFKTYPDATYTDFVQTESSKLRNCIFSDFDIFWDDTTNKEKMVDTISFWFKTPKDRFLLNEYINAQDFQNIIYSQKKKEEFLDNQYITIQSSENKESKIEEPEIQPYDTDSIKEKITLLHELGVIEHFEKIPPFNYPNGLAKLLGTIMNADSTTIQPYLNPIINETRGNNNPLKPKLIQAVQNKLTIMGVDSKHFKTPTNKK